MYVLLFPERTVTFYAGEEVSTTQRTCTRSDDLVEARQAAQALREQGWRVSIYRTTENGNPRIRVELREPVGGRYVQKRTRIFKIELEALAYLTNITNHAVSKMYSIC
jgi:hypothetical protein